MRDGEREATEFVGARVVGELVVEQPEEWFDPRRAGHAAARVSRREPFAAVLEERPEAAGISEGSRDLIGETALGARSSTVGGPLLAHSVGSGLALRGWRCRRPHGEVGRLLTRQLAGAKLVDEVGPEQAAFDPDRWMERHWIRSSAAGRHRDTVGFRGGGRLGVASFEGCGQLQETWCRLRGSLDGLRRSAGADLRRPGPLGRRVTGDHRRTLYATTAADRKFHGARPQGSDHQRPPCHETGTT